MRSAGSLRPDAFYAIAHPTRRRLLDRLGRSGATAGRLAKPFRMTRPAVASHLRILRKAGLVTVRRRGRERHYQLAADRLREVYDWITPYRKFWTDKLSALGEYLDSTP